MRWLAPSAAAASGGAVLAGLVEGTGMHGPLGIAAAAGFVVLVAFPILLAASIVTRGLWHGWQPRALGLVEESGSAPRLAGWIAYLWLATLGLAWVMFQGTWLLASATAFKPGGMAFAEPVLATAAALLLVALSRPAARGLTWVYTKVDRRFRITPLRLFVSLAIKTAILALLVWFFFMKKRLGTLDFGLLHVPVAGIAGTALVHLAWHRLPRARRAGYALGALAALLLGTALFAWQARPNLTLAIWGERPIAGLAIDRIFNLDRIRAGISLAEFRPVEKPNSPHPDIILVTIDTVRADHTPPYGGNAEMPLLRELATRGVVYDWAFAPSNVTRRSIPSMVIGLAPNRVKGRVVGWALRVDPRHVLLAERMLAGGYETAGFVCCGGFWGEDFRTGLQRGLAHLEIEPNGMKLSQLARKWLDAREHSPGPHKPLFLWMHILEPHNWQLGTGAPANDEEKKRFYDRSLTASDAMLVNLLAPFTNRRPEDAPIVIVTADHGEALGDHGQPYHSTDLYNSQIRVPFVIAGPGIKPGHVTETVSLTDLTPTVLELAGFVPPTDRSMDGISVADLATGRRLSTPDGGTAFSAMIKDRSNPGGITSVVHGKWKLIDNGNAPELYDVHADPNEASNVATARPQVYNELRALLTKFVAAGSSSPFE